MRRWACWMGSIVGWRRRVRKPDGDAPLLKRQRRLSTSVGWVERSETHRSLESPTPRDIAALPDHIDRATQKSRRLQRDTSVADAVSARFDSDDGLSMRFTRALGSKSCLHQA